MKGPHFLVIDDERNFREFLGEALQGEGYRVSLAGTARAGLAIARAESPQIVLLDQNLPDGSGLEMIQELRRLSGNPVVVMITAYGDYASAVRAVKAGAYHYLTKPFGFPELLDIVRGACVAQSMDVTTAQHDGMASIVGTDPRILELKQRIARIARTPVATVLVGGESGTGKELVAQAIHALSDRATRRLVCVNCAALTETLLMDELFGHERGAFTDARSQKQGLFELAHRGTLFLDEISEMGPRAQAALLRVLEQRRVTRVGGTEEIPVDVRVIAASNRDIARHVTDGSFRADLYYRLNVVDVPVPPLRSRRGDILALARHFGCAVAERFGESERALDPAAEALLVGYDWPGNVRELRNAIERAYAISSRPVIEPADLPAELRMPDQRASRVSAATRAALVAAGDGGAAQRPGAQSRRFQDMKREMIDGFERSYLEEGLARAGGNVTLAAEQAGVLRQVFQRMLARHGLTGEQFRL
ncbi:MAG: two component, sigma54 specific, transcriptional regulator, Fis family [Gemmatimonadetes bacterium]|jgi:two-component system response regulator AtoC|nr:two component, sigma54 specific, transcriptional regulator, Fis family [Gemmatimonadota bacterium]